MGPEPAWSDDDAKLVVASLAVPEHEGFPIAVAEILAQSSLPGACLWDDTVECQCCGQTGDTTSP